MPVRMAVIIKTKDNKCCQRNGEKEFFVLLVGLSVQTSAKQLKVPQITEKSNTNYILCILYAYYIHIRTTYA
jgi:hypothetical protein